MNTLHTLLTSAALLAAASSSPATVMGFGQLGGSNTTVPSSLGSNATADGNGYVVTNGTTPNIALTWDPEWDIHTSVFFTDLEANTIGGGDWDDEGALPRIGQLDLGAHSIAFSVDAGYALVLNSLDFAHTSETPGTTTWNLTLTNSASTPVWNETVVFVNGQAVSVAPAFTGANGEDYTLTFTRTLESYNSNGRHGIDNLDFSQVTVPEPGSAAMLGLAGLTLLRRRRL